MLVSEGWIKSSFQDEATLHARRCHHSSGRICRSESHGTQSLLLSSNSRGCGTRNPEKHSAVQFRPAALRAENEAGQQVSFVHPPSANRSINCEDQSGHLLP